ncbi:hypothetical protein ACHAXT_003690 [Thalassiosira profunda]
MFNRLAATLARRSVAAAASRPAFAPSLARPAPSTAITTLRPFSDYGDDAPAGDAGKQKGTVKWFDARKGFGFLLPDDPDAAEVFVHHSAIHARGFRTLGDGEPVEFEVITEPNGRSKALNVTGPDGDYVQGAPRRMDDGYGGGGGGYGGGGGGGYGDGGGY